MGSHSSSKALSNGTSHRHHLRQKHKNVRKPFLVLHVLNAIFSLVSICIFAAILPLWNANFFHKTGLLRGDWPDGLSILPLFVALVASLHYLIRRLIAHRSRTSKSSDYLKTRSKSTYSACKPLKLQIYLTLTTLILLLTFLILAGVSGLYRFWRPSAMTSSMKLSYSDSSSNLFNSLAGRSNLNSSPTSLTPPTGSPSTSSTRQKATTQSCTLSNIFTRRCNPTLYLIGDLQIAAISISVLVWFVNLTLLVLQTREFQYQKRKQQKSLRAKARAKLEIIDDELSRAEKGHSPTRKKIHYERGVRNVHAKADSNQSTHSSAGLGTESQIMYNTHPVTRPTRAYTTPTTSRNGMQEVHPPVRPKQHHYKPNISPSRSRSVREQTGFEAENEHSYAYPETQYSMAVEEARRKVKPAETMRDWLAGRYV